MGAAALEVVWETWFSRGDLEGTTDVGSVGPGGVGLLDDVRCEEGSPRQGVQCLGNRKLPD